MASPIIQIQECLNQFQNFVLNGGAGSGKTFSLEQVIALVHRDNPYAKIACITYTNVAADEIKKRIPIDNLWVSTIHEFLWSSIKSYTKNMKSELKELVETEKTINSSEDIDWNKIVKIQYKEYKKLTEGIISHDEVLKLSVWMISKYPLLKKIIGDKFQYLFIDEYQDTYREVIDALLDVYSFPNRVMGLFGDPMQSIYSTGIGNVENHIKSGEIFNIIKQDNYRCSQRVIDFINRIRTDGIQQQPALKDENDKILNLEGSVYFVYTNNQNISMDQVRKIEIFSDWNFNNPQETKELYLTHKLIAGQNKFFNLFKACATKKDSLTGNNKDKLILHLLRIASIIDLYKNRKYNELIKLTDLKIRRAQDKFILKENINSLLQEEENTVEKAIQLADKFNLVKIDDNISSYLYQVSEEEWKNDLYEHLKPVSFEEVLNFYRYENNTSIYSTQHGVKGAEFENVLVVLDNGNWNLYNFTNLFTNKGANIERTKKLFYVACSRAKKNLVIYMASPSRDVLEGVKKWLPEGNIILIN